jgi:hypothetical protein
MHRIKVPVLRTDIDGGVGAHRRRGGHVEPGYKLPFQAAVGIDRIKGCHHQASRNRIVPSAPTDRSGGRAACDCELPFLAAVRIESVEVRVETDIDGAVGTDRAVGTDGTIYVGSRADLEAAILTVLRAATLLPVFDEELAAVTGRPAPSTAEPTEDCRNRANRSGTRWLITTAANRPEIRGCTWSLAPADQSGPSDRP